MSPLVMRPAPLTPQTQDGGLTINSVDMRCAAWAITDLTPLWLGPPRRGTDAPVQDEPGLRAYAPLDDAGSYDLELIVSGFHTLAGVRNSDPFEGLATNLAYLHEHVIDIPPNPTGTYASTLGRPGALSDLTADVRVLPLVVVKDPDMPVKVYSFTIWIPAGRYA